MAPSDIVFVAFTLFNGLQIISYIPQIIAVGRDENGASAISYSSWLIWLAGAVATVAYAMINIWDIWLALVNGVHAICCFAVILLTKYKRSRRMVDDNRSDQIGSDDLAAAAKQSPYRPPGTLHLSPDPSGGGSARSFARSWQMRDVG